MHARYVTYITERNFVWFFTESVRQYFGGVRIWTSSAATKTMTAELDRS
jgi:hypothetical protein